MSLFCRESRRRLENFCNTRDIVAWFVDSGRFNCYFSQAQSFFCVERSLLASRRSCSARMFYFCAIVSAKLLVGMPKGTGFFSVGGRMMVIGLRVQLPKIPCRNVFAILLLCWIQIRKFELLEQFTLQYRMGT